MARNKTTIAVQITGDAKDLAREFQAAEQKSKGFQGVMTGVGAAVGAIIASDMIGKVVEFGKRMDAMATESEQIKGRLDTTFGDMADVARQWADDNNEAFGESEEKVMEFLGSVQDTLVPLGFAREDAAEMTFDILELANALAEWKPGATAEQATGALVAALTGEREQLKGFGIVLKDTDIKARLAEQGLSGLTGEAEKQAIAQATLELATEGSKDALAAYEERTGTAIAKTKELAAGLADAERAMADVLKPETDYVKEVIAGWVEGLGGVADAVAEARGESDNLERRGFLRTIFENRGLEATSQWLYELAGGTGELGDTVGETEQKWRDANAAVFEARDAMDEARHSARELDGKIRNVHGAFMESTEGVTYFYTLLETESLEAARKFDGHVKEMKGYIGGLPDAFDGAGEEVELSFDEMLSNLREDTEQHRRWVESIEEMYRLGLDDTARMFQEKGPEAAAAAEEFLAQPLEEQLDFEGEIEAAERLLGGAPARWATAMQAGSTGRYRSIMEGIGDRWAQMIEDGWNSHEWELYGPKIVTQPGGTLAVDASGHPLPALHDGGVFRAGGGRKEGLALLHDGETVLPTHKPGWGMGGGSETIQVVLDGAVIAEAVRRHNTVAERHGVF